MYTRVQSDINSKSGIGMKEIQDRLPKNALEQVAKMQSEWEIEKRIKLKELFDNVCACLEENGIGFDKEKSKPRLKTRERVQDKIDRRGSDDLILDKYGLRFVVTSKKDKYKAQKIIEHYYVVPEFFKNKPGVRDHSKKEIKDFQRQNFNSNTTDDYTGLNINLLFGKWESPDVAEVQLMTKREFKRAEKSREAYLNAQKRNGSSHSK